MNIMVLLGSRVKIVIKSGWKNPMTGEEEDDGDKRTTCFMYRTTKYYF